MTSTVNLFFRNPPDSLVGGLNTEDISLNWEISYILVFFPTLFHFKNKTFSFDKLCLFHFILQATM